MPVLDTRAWLADDDFIDGHHLFPRSAADFTMRLGREMLAPLVAGRPRAVESQLQPR